MTLKDFSKDYLLPEDAWRVDNEPFWRKEFPTNLRIHKIVTKDGYYIGGLFQPRVYIEPEFKEVLEEEWVRIHNNQIIDREWRKVYIY